MHPLDNVIWKALTTSDAHFAECYGSARRFPPEVTALGAFSGPERDGFESIKGLLPVGGSVALFLPEPTEAPADFEVVRAIPLFQMLHDGRELEFPAQDHIELGGKDVPEMLVLAQLTRPGPFGQRTRELGRYLGIRRQGCLVAMAGERLRLPGYTEVSAVCTHPEHIGRGYAASLIGAVVGKIQERGDSAMLHVAAENQRAIDLYERLGFRKRVGLHLLVIRKRDQH